MRDSARSQRKGVLRKIPSRTALGLCQRHERPSLDSLGPCYSLLAEPNGLIFATSP